MALQSFTPDDDYCVYCHAPAAGPCAECGALCCGDCVEVVLQLSISRAICRQCFADRPPSLSERVSRSLGAMLSRLKAAFGGRS